MKYIICCALAVDWQAGDWQVYVVLAVDWQVFAKTSKGRVRKSIFATPDSTSGRVGIGTCGVSGRPMTKFTYMEKWKKWTNRRCVTSSAPCARIESHWNEWTVVGTGSTVSGLLCQQDDIVPNVRVMVCREQCCGSCSFTLTTMAVPCVASPDLLLWNNNSKCYHLLIVIYFLSDIFQNLVILI